MATLVVQQHHQNPIGRSSTPPLSPALSINIPRATTPVPNKHIPFCPAGTPPPSSLTVTPPNSPPARSSPPRSILHPPSAHIKLLNSPPVYGIDAKTLSLALDHASTNILPDPQHVFPWLHGLHPSNQIQLSFFVAKKKWLMRTPKGLRTITLIKAGGDLSRCRIKGSVAPDEVLTLSDAGRDFVECDPREGFSVRNFQIQSSKIARLSDIVIYGDENTDHRVIKSVAERTSAIQRRLRKDLEGSGQSPDKFHTFVLTTPFHELANEFPDLVVADTEGRPTPYSMDFLQWERREMCEMSKASEFSQGVYQGPTPHWNAILSRQDPGCDYDIFIEATDQAILPDDDFLSSKTRQLAQSQSIHVDFPSSGSILALSWSTADIDGLLRMCRWMYDQTHSHSDAPSTPSEDSDGDIQMTSFVSAPARKILIHCADGYTEITLLSIAYYMYAQGVPVHTAWIEMHCDQQRNFFAYHSDVAVLTSIQDRILAESPARQNTPAIPTALDQHPAWLENMDGSLPSRILPYMYLGNLTHANNPAMLRSMGIRRLLSIGEPVSWSDEEKEEWGESRIMLVNKVQDNGIDPLTEEFERCLDFIAQGKAERTATLVHCRVGVSRSATICIAEVMCSLNLSFPRAYCFVRARRLNVIIQPHLRFVWELLRWDAVLQQRRGERVSRDMEWQEVCREIAGMNRPYART